MILALGLVGLRTAFVGIGSATRGSNRVAMEAERKFIVGLLTSRKGGGMEISEEPGLAQNVGLEMLEIC